MKLVGDFLARFQNLTPPHDSVKNAIVKTLEETLHITCRKEDVSVRGGVAFIRLSSVAKNVLLVNRARVLENLFERLPKARETVRDVR